MTKLLYAINEVEGSCVQLNHTYDMDIISKNIIQLVKGFVDDYNNKELYNDNDDKVLLSDILEKITKSFDNNEDFEVSACNYKSVDELTIVFEKIGKQIYFKIVSIQATDYYYNVKTIDLDKLEGQNMIYL